MRVALIVSLALFVALTAAAMAAYPGGSWVDPRAIGHSFWDNFLCDVQQPVAIGGGDNTLGARLALCGVLAMIVALACGWVLVARMIPVRVGRVVRALGMGSSFALVLLPLTPSLRWGIVHVIAVVLAGVPALVAGVVAAGALVRDRAGHPSLRVVSALLVVAVAVDGGLYAHHVVADTHVTTLLPALQKVAAILLAAWLCLVARYAPPRSTV